MSELSYWTKTSKLNNGYLGTALAHVIKNKTKRKLAFAGILTVTDNFSDGLNSDDVGQKIQNAINQINTYQVIVKVRKIVSSNLDDVTSSLKDWSDNLNLDIILTLGGVGIDPSSITPDATKEIIDKEIPGLTLRMITSGLQLDPFSVLFRGVCGVRKTSLIVNLPSNVERAATCFSVLLPHIPNALESLKGTSNELQSGESFSAPSDLPSNRTATPVKQFSLLQHRVQAPSPTPSHHSFPAPSIHHKTNLVHHVTVAPDFSRTPNLTHADSGVTTSNSLSNHHLTDRLPSHHQTDRLPSHHQTDRLPSHHQTDRLPSHHQTDPLPSHHQSDRLPSHHHSERIHHSSTLSVPDETEEPLQLTEEDIFGSESVDGLIAKESIRFDADLSEEVDSSDSAIVGSDVGYSKIARRHRTSPYTEVSVDKATSTIFAVTSVMPVVEMLYKDALNHVLASDVIAPSPSPASDVAILDGYAVVADDVPGNLEVVSLSKTESMKSGMAVRIATGSAMPLGSNAVVPVEETLLVSESNDGRTEVCVRFTESAIPGQYIRPKGSDMKPGEVVLKSGTVLGHLETAILVSVGVTSVLVHKCPVVAIISYGSNLREPDDPDVGDDQVRDSNRVMLSNALKQQGFPVVDMGIVNGGSTALKDTIQRAYEQADVVVTTGGAAVGENDVVKPVLVDLGALLHFGRVVVKPGAPTAFATLDTQRGKKLFFALAGVPVPAYIGYFLFVLPCLRRLNGAKDPRSPVIKVRASSSFILDVVPEYKRASLRYEARTSLPWADVTGVQVVSRILSLAAIDAFLILPSRTAERRAIKRGEVLDAIVVS